MCLKAKTNKTEKPTGNGKPLLLFLVAINLGGTLLSACASDDDDNNDNNDGVGDQCLPTIIPVTVDQEGVVREGFVTGESYIETGSVQCETGVCGIFNLTGNPSPTCTPYSSQGGTCPSQAMIEAKVYCTCRCNAPTDSKLATCTCPKRYECAEVLELGDADVRGSYCVKTGSLVNSR
jgi:hypothetical protein